MTDIVERLEDSDNEHEYDAPPPCNTLRKTLAWEAADEIKRLREENKNLWESMNLPRSEDMDEIERLRQRVAELEAGQGEPVAVVRSVTKDEVRIKWIGGFPQIGGKLYTSAPTIPEGWQLVPVNVIAFYEAALKASWPNGAIGDAFENWNDARKSMLAAAPKP